MRAHASQGNFTTLIQETDIIVDLLSLQEIEDNMNKTLAINNIPRKLIKGSNNCVKQAATYLFSQYRRGKKSCRMV